MVPHDDDNFTHAYADKAIKVFNASGEKLAREGFSLCYYAHGREFALPVDGSMFDYMAGKMNPKFANFEMDVSLVKEYGTDPLKLFNKYSSRIKMIHFNLKDRKPGKPDSNAGHADVETNLVSEALLHRRRIEPRIATNASDPGIFKTSNRNRSGWLF